MFFGSGKQGSNDVNFFLNLRIIKKQKPAVFEKILYANELKVKTASLNVPDPFQKTILIRT